MLYFARDNNVYHWVDLLAVAGVNSAHVLASTWHMHSAQHCFTSRAKGLHSAQKCAAQCTVCMLVLWLHQACC
jgi:hypothetical protein